MRSRHRVDLLQLCTALAINTGKHILFVDKPVNRIQISAVNISISVMKAKITVATIILKQVRRQFHGGGSAPAYLQPLPPPSHGSRKTLRAPRTDTHQLSDSGRNTKVKSLSTAVKWNDVRKLSTLLSSGNKTSGQPPVIHPPWNKARVRPLADGDGRRDRMKERKAESVERGFEKGEAGKRETDREARVQALERATERGGREMETRRRNAGIGSKNEVRNAAERGKGLGPEHRGELPNLLSTGHFGSLDSRLIFNGSYFQTPIEANKLPPVKQKLSNAHSLISLARRLQGPARVGDEQWRNGKSWDRGERTSRKMHGSAGDISVSTSLHKRAFGEDGRRFGEQVRGEKSASDVWWRREKRCHDSGSETGSKESLSEFSPSAESSLTSSVTTKPEDTESELDTEKTDTGTEEEEGIPDTGSESMNRSESERESGLESEKEGKKLSTNTTSSNSENSGAKCDSSSPSSNSNNKAALCRSGPRTSSHETIEEEDETREEEEEVRKIQSWKPSRPAPSSDQPDVDSCVLHASDNLSPIIEDTEEEERRG